MVSELDCWMEWIENQMAEEMYDVPTEDDMEDFVGGIAEKKREKMQKIYLFYDITISKCAYG